jgi:methionyl-tRNA formyltransferase
LTPEFAQLEQLVSLWDVHNRIRACDPFPGASLPTPESPKERWKLFGSEWPETFALDHSEVSHYVIDNQGIKLFSADTYVVVHEVQWPGKRRMSATDFVRGSRLRGRFTLSGQKID